jgi:Tfp pilus assembly protein PilF
MRMRQHWLTGLALLAAGSLMTAGCDRGDRAERYLQRGIALFEQGDLVKSELELKNALQVDPRLGEAWFMLGRIAEADAAWQQAFGAYGKAV